MIFPQSFSLINPFCAVSSLSSLSVSPSTLSSLKLHRHLRNFSPDSPSPISIVEASPSPIHRFALTHSSIHPHPHPFSRVFGFGLRFCKNEAPSVLVLTVRWVLINVLEFLCLCFFSLSTRKRGIQLVFVFGF